MNISGELLYHYLSESMSVERMGRDLMAREFSLPEFFLRGLTPEKSRAYIARTRELPQKCPAECLFICVGGRPTEIWNSWRGMVLYLAEKETDLLTVSNHIIRFCDRVGSWEEQMQSLVNRNAPVEELVGASLPLFENCITITDYSFNILVNSDLVGEGDNKQIAILDDFSRIPENVAATLQGAQKLSLLREPYMFKGQRENPEGDNYCINLHMGNTYYGTCTLWNKLRPLKERDKLLFVRFVEYVKQLLSAQPRTQGASEVTLKSIFSDLLHAFPVSGQDLDYAVKMTENSLRLHQKEPGCWHVLVIRSANRNKTLPAEYLCASLEDMLPNCTAVALEEQMIVCLVHIPKGDSYEDTVCDILAPYLDDMNFRTGISAPFDDLMRARAWFLQAAAMLDTGRRYAPEQRICRFSDFILPYMLRHSRGEFEEVMLLKSGLRELKEQDGAVDYWATLRLYLENECNASKTAQDLYLHRSSLLPRLEKIRSLVDMDTPEDRLYLRMCITLMDMEEARKKRKDS